jgi:hypothetical protein
MNQAALARIHQLEEKVEKLEKRIKTLEVYIRNDNRPELVPPRKEHLRGTRRP